MRTFLTLMLAAICVVGYAQKKPKINQALSAMEDGNLAEAKTIIDAAIEHEKTKDVMKRELGNVSTFIGNFGIPHLEKENFRYKKIRERILKNTQMDA